MALSDVKIRKAKTKDKPYKMYDSLGLFVLVKPNGSKLWRQKYQIAGKERTITHGAYPNVSLKDARGKRDKIRDQLADGHDPAVQRRLNQIEKETQARNTFLLVAEEYLQMAYDRELADATMRKKIWHVHTLAAELHHRPIREITAAEVLHVLKRIEQSGRRETAKKLRGTISGVFRHAVVTLRADNDANEVATLLPLATVAALGLSDRGYADNEHKKYRNGATEIRSHMELWDRILCVAIRRADYSKYSD